MLTFTPQPPPMYLNTLTDTYMKDIFKSLNYDKFPFVEQLLLKKDYNLNGEPRFPIIENIKKKLPSTISIVETRTLR